MPQFYYVQMPKKVESKLQTWSSDNTQEFFNIVAPFYIYIDMTLLQFQSLE